MKKALCASLFGAVLLFQFGVSPAYADHRMWEYSHTIVSQVFSLVEKGYLYPLDFGACKSEMLERSSQEAPPYIRGPHTISEVGPEEINWESENCLEQMFDPHTRVVKGEDERNRNINSGMESFGGIGASLGRSQGVKGALIDALEPGSPSERAGMKPGDLITRARNADESDFTDFKDNKEAVEKIRGKVGTEIIVVVEREGRQLEFTLVRAAIVASTVRFKRVREDVGYLAVRGFGPNTADQEEDAINSFGFGESGKIILDLRGNPGGRLEGALETLYYFSKNRSDTIETQRFRINGEVVERPFTIRGPAGCDASYQDASGEAFCPVFADPRTREPKSPGIFSKYRVVVLVDGGSASASEMVSGTLQDWSREQFVVVGTKTFGKGVGQTVVELEGEPKYFLHFTTFEYLVGNGKVSVQGVGVIPTVVVEDTRRKDSPEHFLEDTLSERDAQFQKALSILSQ